MTYFNYLARATVFDFALGSTNRWTF